MTTAVRPTELWSSMPGWGIVANLIPPELILARRVRVVRRALGLLLVLVLVLIMLGFSYAWLQKQSAATDLQTAQARTAQLQAEQDKYQGAVQVQQSITGIDTKLSTLMADDVDFAGLIANLRAELPPTMTIGQLSVSLNQSVAGASAALGASALDATGQTHIGTITVSGKARSLQDLSAYVDRLQTIKGIVEPYPNSNSASATGVSWSVQITLTSALLTHTYDASKIGGN
jgi:hypothetical protein